MHTFDLVLLGHHNPSKNNERYAIDGISELFEDEKNLEHYFLLTKVYEDEYKFMLYTI